MTPFLSHTKKKIKTHAPIGAAFVCALSIGLGLWKLAPLPEQSWKAQFSQIDPVTVASTSDYDGQNKSAHETSVDQPFDDPLMNEAVRISHLHLAKFEAKAKEWADGQFWVETILSDGTHKELLWLKVDEFVVDGYMATLDERVASSTLLAPNQSVHILRQDIVDWRIERQGVLYGAYTTRVRLSQASSKAASDMLEQFEDL